MSTASGDAQGIPTAPLVASDGQVTPAWRRFLMTLLARTGGAMGPGGGAAVPQAVTASPYVYRAAVAGTMWVSGGGVTAMTVRRGGAAEYPTGAFYGGHRLAAGDRLTIAYFAVPTAVFFPD